MRKLPENIARGRPKSKFMLAILNDANVRGT